MESSNECFEEDYVNGNFCNTTNNATSESRRRMLNNYPNCFENPKRQKMSDTVLDNMKNRKRKSLDKNYGTNHNSNNYNNNNDNNDNDEEIDVCSLSSDSDNASLDTSECMVPLPTQDERTRIRNPPPLIHTPDTPIYDLTTNPVKLLPRLSNTFCDTLPPPTYEDGVTLSSSGSNHKPPDNWKQEKQLNSNDDHYYTGRSSRSNKAKGRHVTPYKHIWSDMDVSSSNPWKAEGWTNKTLDSPFWDNLDKSTSKYFSSNLFEEQYSLDSRITELNDKYTLPKQSYIDRWTEAIDLTIPASDELLDYSDYRYSCETPLSSSPPLLEDVPCTFPKVYLGPSTSDGRTISEYKFFRPYNKENDSDDSS